MSAQQVTLQDLHVKMNGDKAVVLQGCVAFKGTLFSLAIDPDLPPDWYLQHLATHSQISSRPVLQSLCINADDEIYISVPGACLRCRKDGRDVCVFCFGGYL